MSQDNDRLLRLGVDQAAFAAAQPYFGPVKLTTIWGTWFAAQKAPIIYPLGVK